MRLILDIETNKPPSKIWMVGTLNPDTGEKLCHTSPNSLSTLLEASEQLIGHGAIAFDFRLLKNLWGLTIPRWKMRDTLVMSRLLKPDREGGHSLEAWGRFLKCPKSDYKGDYVRSKGQDYVDDDEWNNPDLELMEAYCLQDVEVTAKLLRHLDQQLAAMKFSERSIQLEHDVAEIVQRQVDSGVLVDDRKLFLLKAELDAELARIEKSLTDVFPPTEVVMKTKTKYVPFNPGSRQQIAQRLMEKGWKPVDYTEKGNIVVDDEVLEGVKIPEAQVMQEFFVIQKRVSQVAQWIKYLEEDCRIRGHVMTNGAVTGRMTHSTPNLAQVPANDKPWGPRCRELFIAPKGYRMVGADASGLELRMLAHYMNDPDYTREVTEGDVHWKNVQALGFVPIGTVFDPNNPAHKQYRNNAKTFIYAFLYGAGAAKIGSIVGGSAKKGTKLIDSFLEHTPALKALREKVARNATKGHIQGLDGRRIRIRHEHAALNSLLQGAGAILMKEALVIYDGVLTQAAIPATIVLNIHDEWQTEVREDLADMVGVLAVKSIEKAGTTLGLRCPVTGSYHIGQNWSETH